MKLASLISVVVFLLVALAHALRVAFGLELSVGDVGVPQWVSVVGALATAGLAAALWRESHPRRW